VIAKQVKKSYSSKSLSLSFNYFKTLTFLLQIFLFYMVSPCVLLYKSHNFLFPHSWSKKDILFNLFCNFGNSYPSISQVHLCPSLKSRVLHILTLNVN
jgi:hypothetical protein